MSSDLNIIPKQVVGGIYNKTQAKGFQTDINGNILNKPINDLSLIDNIKNGYSDKFFGYTFGRKVGVNNTVVDLWEGPTGNYVFPTVGQQMKVVSTNANDTAGGTGCKKIHFHYLDSNYVSHTETITLNGTTPVNTVATDIFRINAIHSWEVGTTGNPEGNISLTNLAGTVTYGFISAGFNWGRQAIYTVPAGVNGYITHWQASSGSTGNHFCQITLRATCHMGVSLPGVFIIVDEQGTQNGGISINFDIPIRIPEKTDVKISAISDASNANVSALGAIMGYFETI